MPVSVDVLTEKNIFLRKKITMIQRIQSVYLLLSTILVGFLFALPIAEIAKDGAILVFNFKGILQDGVVKTSGIAVLISICLAMVVHILAIFNYSNRKKQVQIVWGAMALLVLLLIEFVYFTYLSNSGAQIAFKMGAIFPLVAVILDYLAIRAINKDEALIRSIDRIR
jgi:hypothetical protein